MTNVALSTALVPIRDTVPSWLLIMVVALIAGAVVGALIRGVVIGALVAGAMAGALGGGVAHEVCNTFWVTNWVSP
jgi:hypothetical protein